jgi:hypothetical protein
MSQLNSEGVAEFMRIIDELEPFEGQMSEFERKFYDDNYARIETFGDKVFVSEAQLDYARRIYQRYL